MSKAEIVLIIVFIGWTFGIAFLGYHYGYLDGYNDSEKIWHKKIDGARHKILERKKLR